MAKAAKALVVEGPPPVWVACHDTLVCAGARQIQKWCVRERDDKGPLVAVMLTKDVAHLLAASRETLEHTQLLERSLVYEIKKSERVGVAEGANLMSFTLAMVRATIAKATGTA